MRHSGGRRIAQLATRGEVVFHVADLANLWGISERNNLYITLSRYVKSGLLYRLQKGLYSIKNPKELHPHLLGLKALHGPGYVSCETVLFAVGIINQPPQEITLVGTLSKHFTIADHNFRVRQMRDELLMNDKGIYLTDGVRIANKTRALADMHYFYPQKYLDATIDS